MVFGFGWVQRSEAFDGGGYGDSTILDFDFESVALAAVDIEVVKLVGNFDGDDFLAVFGFGADAHDLSVRRSPAEFFFDFAFDKKFVSTEGIGIIDEGFDIEREGVHERFGFFVKEKFAKKDDRDDCDADADEEDGIGAGTCATSHF